jgi:hypothetical protein
VCRIRLQGTRYAHVMNGNCELHSLACMRMLSVAMSAEKCNWILTLRWDYLKWLCGIGGLLIRVVHELNDVVSRLGQPI